MPEDALLITIDDLVAYKTIRNLFGVELKTPNLDALEGQGVTFENAFASVALCTPSRVAMLTSTSPFTSNVHGNQDDWQKMIDLSKTLPAIFKQNSYDTYNYGKVFPNMSPDIAPAVFNKFADYKSRGIEDVEGQTADFLNVAEAIEQMNSHSGTKPLMMAVGFHDPHGPFISPDKYADLYPVDQIQLPDWKDETDMPAFVRSFLNSAAIARLGEQGMKEFVASYLANITEMDARLGELLKAVETDPNFNPVIAVTSDHGYHLGSHDHIHKFTLWDEGARAPLIIVNPNAAPETRGQSYEGVVSLLDIAPTLLDLAGLPIPAHFQGRSLRAAVEHPDQTQDGEAITSMWGSISYRTNEFRLTRYEDGSLEFFDLANDPENVVNLAKRAEWADEIAAVRAEMEAELAEIGVKIDEARDLIIKNAGAGDSTYFVTDTSNTVSFTDAGGRDTVYSALNTYTLPSWAENLASSGSREEEKEAYNFTGNALANVIVGGHHNDILNGAAGNDTLYGGRGNNTERGGDGNDLVRGDLGKDQLFGDLGNDVLDGRAGTDTMNGGLGNDTYVVDTAGDIVVESSTVATQIDTVNSSVTRTLGANQEYLTLTGSAAINGIGNTLANRIVGNSAVNVLNGGVGADTMNGGGGADTFRYTTGNDSLDTARDLIQGFAPEDQIDLSLLDANTGTAANDPFQVVTSLTIAQSTAGSLYLGPLSGSERLTYLNMDADTAFEMVIRIQGTISTADFTL